MKQMLNENDIEQVVGGTVVVSADKMKIGFTTTGQKYNLQNCTYGEAMAEIYTMYAQYTNQGQTFDAEVREAFKSKGWISD